MYVTEQLLVIDDMAIVLVVTVKPVGTADGLEQVMVLQFVVQVDVGATGSIKAGKQLADHDQQLHAGRLFDEASLGFVFVLLGGLAGAQHMLLVGVVFVAFVAAR
ncbi:hypothetical protein D3C86_1648540 [compost metagenome]